LCITYSAENELNPNVVVYAVKLGGAAIFPTFLVPVPVQVSAEDAARAREPGHAVPADAGQGQGHD
jgi:hypothetical protein